MVVNQHQGNFVFSLPLISTQNCVRNTCRERAAIHIQNSQAGPQIRKLARKERVAVKFVADEGAGSHGTLYFGGRKTTVKDRKKDISKGLLTKMLKDLGIEPNDL